MKNKIYSILGVFCIVLVGGYYYAAFPAINIHDPSFWTTLFLIFLVLGVVATLRRIVERRAVIKIRETTLPARIFFGLGFASLAVLLVGELSSLEIFRAKSYASLLQVEDCDFAEDIEESEKVTNIALMDTESAQIFGERKIGSLSQVVSQFEVEQDYNQINIKGTPMKVAPLKYASFFKWWNNRKKRVPGYVQVNPVNSDAQYIALEKGMRYLPSGYFNDNLQRHVQLKYPTKLISGYYFEVDDQGEPYFICPTLGARVGLFGGMDINGAIICDPVDGSCRYYQVEDIPAWVDRVYDGKLLTRKFNWYGILSDGYLNSIFSQSGCRKTTDDYGYKTIEDDVWIYTGVTSVTGDQSNIGFVMMNQRTSQAKYYNVSGAEEHSAMASAEGQVQEKGYRASFPSLINVSGIPTYIMVLKDNGGLVKMYAMVNVEQYNIVATADSQSEVFANYKKLLASEGAGEVAQTQTRDIVVSDIQYIDTDDGTVVYIKDNQHNVYKQAFADNEALIKITTGDAISVTYEPMEDGIHYMTEYTFTQ